MSRDDDGRNEGREASPWPIVLLLGIFALPALLVAGSIYLLLRLGRLKASVIGAITLGFMALAVAIWFGSGALENLQGWYASGLDSMKEWERLVPAAVSLSFLVGAPLGYGAVLWELRQIRLNPHRTEVAGSWTYRLKFRRTPRELLKRKRIVEDLSRGALMDPVKAPMGIDEEDEFRPVYRYLSEAFKHTLIVGATGSGKTKTMQSLIRNDIVAGIPTVIIDMKRDPEFASMLATWTKEEGGSFYHFVNGAPEDYDVPGSPGQAFYDPLKAGSATSKADMVLGLREFDTASEIYKQNLTQLLQVLFAMLRFAKRDHEVLMTTGFFDKKGRRVYDTTEFVERAEIRAILERELSKHEAEHGRSRGAAATFNPVARLKDLGLLETRSVPRIDWNNGGIYQLASAVYGDNLDALCQACVGTRIEPEAMELRALLDRKLAAGSGMRNAVGELQGQMRTIIASEYGQWLKSPEGGERSIDLFRLTQKQGTVILFSLNSDSEPEFARYIGSLIMADITNVSARRRNENLKNPVMVYVDEFQTLVPSSVAGLLEKSRASRIAMTLAQQSFEQIIKSSPKNGEAYLGSILDTCSNFIVHAGMTEDSAERLSKVLGKEMKEVYKVTNKHEGFLFRNNWSNRRNQQVMTGNEEQWIFPPERFLKLSSPDPANKHKATAIIVNKTSSDPTFKGRAGALAREVRMVPAKEVLEEYYKPVVKEADSTLDADTFLDDLDEESPMGAIFLEAATLGEDESVKDLFTLDDDEDYEEAPARPLKRRPAPRVVTHEEDDDYEDADGGFSFETIEEEEDEETMLSFTLEEEDEGPHGEDSWGEVEDEDETSEVLPPPRESSFTRLAESSRYGAPSSGAPKGRQAPAKKTPARPGPASPPRRENPLPPSLPGALPPLDFDDD